MSKGTFIGNVRKEYQDTIYQTSAETGFSVSTGQPRPSGRTLIGVYTHETGNTDPFWTRYHQLLREKYPEGTY